MMGMVELWIGIIIIVLLVIMYFKPSDYIKRMWKAIVKFFKKVWYSITHLKKEKLTRLDNPELTVKNEFLPSHQGLYFQNTPPSLTVENKYHQLMQDECGGNYGDYDCRKKAYFKTMKDGTFDRTDLICQQYQNENDYYDCLDKVYGNYMY